MLYEAKNLIYAQLKVENLLRTFEKIPLRVLRRNFSLRTSLIRKNCQISYDVSIRSENKTKRKKYICTTCFNKNISSQKKLINQVRNKITYKNENTNFVPMWYPFFMKTSPPAVDKIIIFAHPNDARQDLWLYACISNIYNIHQ